MLIDEISGGLYFIVALWLLEYSTQWASDVCRSHKCNHAFTRKQDTALHLWHNLLQSACINKGITLKPEPRLR